MSTTSLSSAVKPERLSDAERQMLVAVADRLGNGGDRIGCLEAQLLRLLLEQTAKPTYPTTVVDEFLHDLDEIMQWVFPQDDPELLAADVRERIGDLRQRLQEPRR